MIPTFTGSTADQLYADVVRTFRHHAFEELTRNGPALSIPQPAVLELRNSRDRVLMNPDRDANPFFHLMESIWMWAGRNDLEFLYQFNKGMAQFADEGTFNAAYGFRWRKQMGFDQLPALRDEICADHGSRQHVLQIWEPVRDRLEKKDKACNTQIMFRVGTRGLNMTVINRSNDVVWGALGANIVHMTMLHELMAVSCDLEMATYRVFSNNLHVYEQHYPLLDEATAADAAVETGATCHPIDFWERTELEDYLGDAETFCSGGETFINPWFAKVALPMKLAYLDKPNRQKHINSVECKGWRDAAQAWTDRRTK